MFGAEPCVGCQGHNYHPEDKNRENRSKFIVTVLGTKVTQDDLENVVRTQEENQQVESGWEKGRRHEGPEATETSEPPQASRGSTSLQELCRTNGDEKRMGRNCETTAVTQLEMETIRES